MGHQRMGLAGYWLTPWGLNPGRKHDAILNMDRP
ncbi:hypothetical protein ACHAW6_002230 [Cyclotella cf. meneghiniana]